MGRSGVSTLLNADKEGQPPVGTLTLNADKEIWGQAPGSRSEVFYCRQTDENGDRAAIFDLFAAREKQIKGTVLQGLNYLFHCRQTNKGTSPTSFFD